LEILPFIKWGDLLKESDEKHGFEEYMERFIQFSNAMERVLIKLFVLFLILLVLVQTAEQVPSVRNMLVKVDQMEGHAYADFPLLTKYGE